MGLFAFLLACEPEQTSPGDTAVTGGILTAYFGYDGCLGIADADGDGSNVAEAESAACTVVEGETNAPTPLALAAVCAGQAGADELVALDGLPVVLSEEVDVEVEASQFEVDVSELGTMTTVSPVCATLVPAIEENEDRTVLLLGEFGDATTSGADAADKAVPMEVRVAGSLLLENGADAQGSAYTGDLLSYHGGPAMVAAGIAAITDDSAGDSGNGCGSETTHVVRVTWSGGVTLDGVSSLEATQTDAFSLGVQVGDELVNHDQTSGFTLLALADLDDGDNNVDLCLALSGDREQDAVREVRAACSGATMLYDPEADAPCMPHGIEVDQDNAP